MSALNGSDISGKRIIITGGTSGMGQALVEAFPGLGAQVVFFGRNSAKGHELVAATGARFIQADVCDEAAVKQAIDNAVEYLGGWMCWSMPPASRRGQRPRTLPWLAGTR